MKDEEKTKERLINELVELRQRVAELETLESKRKRAKEAQEQSRNELEISLRERLKELKCVYGIASVVEKANTTLHEIYQDVVNLLLDAWQYPEITCARIIIGDKEFRTENYRETEWKQSSDIKIYGAKAGTVDVNYLEERAEIDEGPFLEHERLLLNAIAERLGRISERKQAEEALREREEKYRVLTESLLDAVYEFNLEGKFLYANEASTRMFGYSMDEILNSIRVNDTIDEKDVIVSRRDINEILKGEATVGERTFVRKDGTKFVGEVHSGPIYEGKDVVGVRGVLRDITERRRVEETLWESEKKHKELAESISDVFFAFNQELRYSYWNKASEELTGISAKDALGKHLYDLFPDAEMTRTAEKVYLKVLRTKQPQHFVNKYELGGKDYFFEISAYPTRNGLSVFAKDITERKRLEEALIKARDELEMRVKERTAELENLIKELTKEVTERKRAEEERRALSRRLVQIQEDERRAIARELHDQIGQSLTGLKLLLATAMRLPAEDVGSTLREAKALINELMSQARTLSLELRPSMLDDLGLLAALVWHLERYTAQTHVRVNFQHAGLDRHLPLPIRTAAYRIVQEVLTNVARHAGVSEVSVRVWTGKNTLFVLIEDQGTGFEPAKLPMSESSGLNGMCERALLLGGKLTVESAPGVGTSVTAELPLPHLSKNRKKERQG